MEEGGVRGVEEEEEEGGKRMAVVGMGEEMEMEESEGAGERWVEVEEETRTTSGVEGEEVVASMLASAVAQRRCSGGGGWKEGPREEDDSLRCGHSHRWAGCVQNAVGLDGVSSAGVERESTARMRCSRWARSSPRASSPPCEAVSLVGSVGRPGRELGCRCQG